MTDFVLILLAIVAAFLTVWFITIPGGVVVGGVKALRRGGRDWKGWKMHRNP